MTTNKTLMYYIFQDIEKEMSKRGIHGKMFAYYQDKEPTSPQYRLKRSGGKYDGKQLAIASSFNELMEFRERLKNFSDEEYAMLKMEH